MLLFFLGPYNSGYFYNLAQRLYHDYYSLPAGRKDL